MAAMKIETNMYEDIAVRVTAGETFASIAEDYEVSRQRIHQIAKSQGATKDNSVAQQAVLDSLGDIVQRRLHWESPNSIFNSYPFTHTFFLRVLEEHPSLMGVWEKADEEPTTRSPERINNLGRVCVRCELFKEWSEYHKGTNANNKSARCKPCASAVVKEYMAGKNVEEPTVTEKVCPGCGELKQAGEFTRSRRRNSGLSTYCRDCMQLWSIGVKPSETQKHADELAKGTA